MLISIVTINYNNLAGLQKTMQSVLAQTYPHIQYIVIDGGSTDGSAEYIAANSVKLAYWISEKDKGIYNAQNKGTKQATGRFVQILNSGDTLHNPNCIANIVSKILPDTQLVGCDILYDNGKRQHYKKSPTHVYAAYFTSRVLYHPSTLIAKSLHDIYGYYNENFKIVSDWAFLLFVAGIRQAKYQYIAMPLAIFDEYGVSSTPSNKEVSGNERVQVWDELLSLQVSKELQLLQYLLDKQGKSYQQVYEAVQNELETVDVLKQKINTNKSLVTLWLTLVTPVSWHYKKLLFKMFFIK